MSLGAGRLVRLVRRHHRTVAGIADQGVIGLGNLTAGLVVLRCCTKEQYGLYSIAYMTLILLAGLSNALFITQLTVSYHGRADRDGAASAMLCGQLLFGALLGLSGALAAALLPASVLPPETCRLLVVSALICPAVLMHDFLRGYSFMVERAWTALTLDLVLVASWLVILVGLGGAGAASSAATALTALGLAALLATCAGLLRAGLPLRRGLRGTLRAMGEAWEHGRWAVGGSAVTALQNQSHVYMLAWLASARAVAELNAARMLMMPAGLLILGIGRTLVPAMARMAADGRAADMRRAADRTLCGLAGAVALYAAAVGFGHDRLIGALLGKDYDDIGLLVGLWALVLILQAADANLSGILQATKRFRALMVANLWSAGPVLLIAVPMIWLYGPAGNLLALAIGYASLTLLLWPQARRALAGVECDNAVKAGTPVPAAASLRATQQVRATCQ